MLRSQEVLAGLTAAILGATTVGLTASPGASHSEIATSATPDRADRPAGQVKEFSVTVGRLRWELAPGVATKAYAYNGQVPGPELRVTEGDTVRVRVTNTLAEPTTIHWHGVDVFVAMDGAPGLSQEPIDPGGTFTYEFEAKAAGTRWYHAHVNELAQQGGASPGP